MIKRFILIAIWTNWFEVIDFIHDSFYHLLRILDAFIRLLTVLKFWWFYLHTIFSLQLRSIPSFIPILHLIRSACDVSIFFSRIAIKLLIFILFFYLRFFFHIKTLYLIILSFLTPMVNTIKFKHRSLLKMLRFF